MECTICFENITKENKYQTKCNHVFCNSCITNWLLLNLTCPMCRNPIENQNIIYQINSFYQVFVKASKLHFQGKLIAIDLWNNGVRYTFSEIRNSSRPMPNVFWSFNDMSDFTKIINL
jgi:hypothetical protein